MSKKVLLYGDTFDVYEEGEVSDGTRWKSVISGNKKFFVFDRPSWTQEYLKNKLIQKEFGLEPNSFGVVFHRASKSIFISTTYVEYEHMKNIISSL